MRPNILFIFPDQWRADWTALNPRLPVRTPNLLRLAEEGTRFNNAVTPSPLCAPARAALASGMEYDRCGVPDNRVDYPAGQSTFYGMLREAGYHVMGCGKFDLAKVAFGWKIDGSSRLNEWGFDEGIDSEGKWDAISSGSVEPRGPYMSYLEERGLRLMHVQDMQRRRENMLAAFATPLPEDAYGDNWIGASGLRLLTGSPRNKPWFLQVNFAGPHDPWDITEAMTGLYRGVDFPVPAGLDLAQAEAHRAVRRNYSAMIENIDRWLGIYVQALRDGGSLSNTLVVVASDHGDMLGERGYWGKQVPYQASITVPLVIRGPRVSRGAVVEGPTTILDLAATMLEFGGVPIPENWDSQTLGPLLEDPGHPPVRKFVFSQVRNWRLVFDGRFKLVEFQDHAELYDLATDPNEVTNLASVKTTLVNEMFALLRRPPARP